MYSVQYADKIFYMILHFAALKVMQYTLLERQFHSEVSFS